MTITTIDGHELTIGQVKATASRAGSEFSISEDALKAMHASRNLKLEILLTGKPIYGVTTGFGDSVIRQISPEKTARLQSELIRYHLNGTGPLASDEVVRATLLIRANCLARGNSGVSTPVVERLLDFLQHDVLPTIPERGSVGASGDLVPLCYLAYALTGEGKVRHRGEVRDAADVLAELGLEPVQLESKDGLALINGTSFSAALASLNTEEAAELAAVADICTALASEGMLGNRGHYAPFIHDEKPHDGQRASAGFIHDLLDGSALSMTHDQVVDLNDPLDGRHFQKLTRSIQDRYSLRCAPHVTGVLRDLLDWTRKWLTVEINSSSDNPLFDPSTGRVYSGGNFYGGHVVTAMDALKTAVAGIADLLDRQLALLVDEKFNNGLTPNLIAPVADDDTEAGLQHGFKGMQIACSALTAEALKSAGPVSTFSRSTEAHNQDKVSMAPIAARDARTIIELTREVAAIHLIAACQAVELRGLEEMSPRTRAVHDLVREKVPFAAKDRQMDGDIAAVVSLITSGAVAAAARTEALV
ncbi:bagremycin/ferroverdin biosynthesis tyrosine ammonia-lyase BagA/FevW [Streptomyces aureocirculatus]|uniref:bagremycin/ferroverdin biosynthesis tyrosine ammonia-lyase BagA/FevW n=1 Tax=Streptomyces aureocirculatus TaxID=67275 RepID=UPI000AAF6E7F|nr:bagremycin/ferroverdin biosynthesis tyrosine ammonia-lyase BagA/FevW [Streptomyces aureocirculatus]